MVKHFRPKPDRFGIQSIAMRSGFAGTAGLALTANATTVFQIPVPFRKSVIERISVSCKGIPVDADGTILATINKRDNIAGANVALTAATSLEVDFVLLVNKNYNIALLNTLTDAQRILQEGDMMFVNIVNNSAAIDTQPDQLSFSVELLLQE